LFVLNKHPKYETGNSVTHLTHIMSIFHLFGRQLSILKFAFSSVASDQDRIENGPHLLPSSPLTVTRSQPYYHTQLSSK